MPNPRPADSSNDNVLKVRFSHPVKELIFAKPQRQRQIKPLHTQFPAMMEPSTTAERMVEIAMYDGSVGLGSSGFSHWLSVTSGTALCFLGVPVVALGPASRGCGRTVSGSRGRSASDSGVSRGPTATSCEGGFCRGSPLGVSGTLELAEIVSELIMKLDLDKKALRSPEHERSNELLRIYLYLR